MAETIPAGAHAAPVLRRLGIEFTGSGSEYFRIWIVNLLLILVTVGLYLPFAKARRIRYFYANTHVDGQALGFHGDPWKMFRGFLLLVVLMGAYFAAGQFSPMAALIAFIALCAIWPALWRASMQFRLGNTSWRGLRMAFDGSLQDAYRAVAPLYLPLIAFIGLSLFADQPAENDAAGAQANRLHAMLLLGSMILAGLMTPWFLTLTKRYQHEGYRLASQETSIQLPASRMYGLCMRAALIGLLPAFLIGVVAAVLVGAVGHTQGESGKGIGLVLFAAAMLVSYLVIFLLGMPYVTSRMQNLVWNGTGSQAVTFDSQLTFRALFWLTLKNWTLVALTLGLYRPFAAVHTARLRLQAVTLTTTEDVAQWSARARPGMQDATGEVAGDFFGIDMGL